MKRRIALIFIAFSTIGLLLYKFTYTSGTDYVVFQSNSTILIIDDWNEIRKITSLFNLNYHFYDCCSGTGDNLYLIQKQNTYRIINRESEHHYLYSNTSIDSQWSRLKKVDKSKVYYKYSIQIPNQANRDSLITAMIKDTYRVIEPFDSGDERPYLKIKVDKQNTLLKSLNELITHTNDSIQNILSDLSVEILQPNIEGQIFNATRNDFSLEYTVYFNDNESCSKATERLKELNFQILEHKYLDSKTILLFSKERDVEKIKKTVMDKYKIIKEIY